MALSDSEGRRQTARRRAAPPAGAAARGGSSDFGEIKFVDAQLPGLMALVAPALAVVLVLVDLEVQL